MFVRKWLLGSLLALVLVSGLVTVLFAQGVPTRSRLRPFVVDIQQTIPVDLILSSPDLQRGDLKLTVPSEVDIHLTVEVRPDGSVSPTVQVGRVSPPLITVSELLESGDALTDNLGLTYQVESDPEIEIIQWVVGENYSGNFKLTGEIRNRTDGATIEKYDLDIVVTLYDTEGRILEAANGYLSLGELDPDATSPFDVSSSTELESVGRYLVQLQWQP